MHPEVITYLAAITHPLLRASGEPVVLRASLGIPDTFFIFVVALVVFGPKRLPEIGKQIGKLVFEFRRASNDFKLQIEEELRMSDQQERQKQLATQAAAAVMATPVTITADSQVSAEPLDTATVLPSGTDQTLVVRPPSSGTLVEAKPPDRSAETEAKTYTPVVDPVAEPAAESVSEATESMILADRNSHTAPAETGEAFTATEGTPTHHG